MSYLKDKVVIITGASSGIGEETARVLVQQGAKVVLSARREDRLETLKQELGENVAYLKSDVVNAEDMEALVKLAKETFGKVDVVFANAGIMPAGAMSELRTNEWNAMVDINIKGVLNLMAAILPEFVEKKKGHIIVTSSLAGTHSVPFNAVYCGTKHFVRAMIDSFRSETVMQGLNIKTTTIYPGMIKTELLNTAADGEGKQQAEKAYAEIGITPINIANAVAYAINQPDDVDVSDITVRPTREA